MPTSSSAKSEGKPKPTTRKRRSRAKVEDVVEEASSSADESFGDGVNGDDAEEKPRRKRAPSRTRTRKKVEEPASESAPVDAVEAPIMSESDSEGEGDARL